MQCGGFLAVMLASIPEQLPLRAPAARLRVEPFATETRHQLFRLLLDRKAEDVMPFVILDDGVAARRERAQFSAERFNGLVVRPE